MMRSTSSLTSKTSPLEFSMSKSRQKKNWRTWYTPLCSRKSPFLYRRASKVVRASRTVESYKSLSSISSGATTWPPSWVESSSTSRRSFSRSMTCRTGRASSTAGLSRGTLDSISGRSLKKLSYSWRARPIWRELDYFLKLILMTKNR